MGSTVPGQRRDPGRKAGPSRRGWGFAAEPHPGGRASRSRGRGEGRVCSPRPSLALARNPTRWASRKESYPGPGPRATSCPRAGLRERLQRGNGTRCGRPARGLPRLSPDPLRTHSAIRRSSAPAPSLVAPSSPGRGAAAAAACHSQPTAAPKPALGGGPFPSGRGRPRPLRRPRPLVTSHASTRARPACAWTEAA